MEDNHKPPMLEKHDVPAPGSSPSPAAIGSTSQRPRRGYLLLAILLHAALLAIAARWSPKEGPQPEGTRAAARVTGAPLPKVYQPSTRHAFRYVPRSYLICGVGSHYPLPEPRPFVSLGYLDSLTPGTLGSTATRREAGSGFGSIRCGGPSP